jgi:hypothetical protein
MWGLGVNMDDIALLLNNPIKNIVIPSGLVPKGAYNNATDYAVGDSVDYLGSSYVMFNNAAAGNLPTDTTYWQVLANKGVSIPIGDGTSQYQTIITGATPFTPVYSGFLLDGTTGGKTILAVTNTKTLTLTSTGDFNLTVPATGTAALLNQANSFTLINPLTTIAESWIGPSSTTGIYFKGNNVGIGTTVPYS